MSDTIAKKIAALLAKAESTSNAFEAEAFMAKVNELLEKHQMELHDVRKADEDRDPMGKQKGKVNLYASMVWARGVAGALARYYGCEFIYNRVGNHVIYQIVGRESARTTFELLLPFVISQVRVQAKQLVASMGTTKSRAEADVGRALERRIYRMVPKAQERRNEMAKNALVPMTDVESFLKSEFDTIKTAKARDLTHSEEARIAAERVSINVQATGKHTKLIAG